MIGSASDPIDVTDEPQAVKDITEAINRGTLPNVYLRGRQLVQVAEQNGDLQTRDLDPDILRSLIADHLHCTRRVGPKRSSIRRCHTRSPAGRSSPGPPGHRWPTCAARSPTRC
jgi:hypothetical protein